MIKPPFLGASDILEISVEELFRHLNKNVLFKLRWKMSSGGEDMLESLLEDKRILDYMQPKAVYGYFPIYRVENKLIIHDNMWEFPLVKGKCIAEYFKTGEEGGDYIALQAVTIGERSVELSRELYKNNDYAEYFMLYGLAAEMTETLAEMLNEKINTELGENTIRRSFGYPSCPDLSYQRVLLELLNADRLDLTLSESNQLIPEFSTTAMVIQKKLV